MEEKREEIETIQPEVTTPIEQPSTLEPANVTNTKKDNKKKKIGIIVGVILLVCIVGVLSISLLINKKVIVDKEVTTLFSQARDFVKNVNANSVKYDFEKDVIGVEGTIKMKSNYKGGGLDLTKLENYTISYKGAIDKKGNQGSIALKLDGKTSILDISEIIKGKNSFLNLGDIYNKVINSKVSGQIKDIDINTITVSDIEKIMNKTEKLIKDSIKNKDIDESRIEKEINGKKGKFRKIAYTFDSQKLRKAIIKGYLEDDEVLEVFSKINSKTKKEVKEELNDSLKYIDYGEKLTVNIYTAGLLQDVKRVELVNDGDDYVSVDIDKGVYTYKAVNDDEVLASGTYDKKKKIFTYQQDISYMKATVEINFINPNKIVGSLKVGMQGINLLSANLEINSKKTGKTSIKDITLKVSYGQGTSKISAELNSSTKFTVGAKVDSPDEVNAIKVEDMTEEEISNIYDKLMDKFTSIASEIAPTYFESSTLTAF